MLNRNYKNNAAWVKYDYDRVVRPSDEAFIWQVMTYYHPVWVNKKSEDLCDRAVVRMKDSSGPKKGFNETTGKTIKAFHSYLQLVGSSRTSSASKLWSARLKQIARERDNEKMAKRSLETRGTRVRTIADDQETWKMMQYARLDVNGTNDEGSSCASEDEYVGGSTEKGVEAV